MGYQETKEVDVAKTEQTEHLRLIGTHKKVIAAKIKSELMAVDTQKDL